MGNKARIHKSKIIEKLSKETSLETRIRVYLQMEDIDNWKDGTYHGDRGELVPKILKIVEKWLIDDTASLREIKKKSEN